MKTKTKYECDYCLDTGWYKAACRYHLCDCKKGIEEFERMSKNSKW